MKKRKIIHIIGSMNIGGAETFLMNILRNIDKERYEFVFVCYGEAKFDYEEEIKKEGARIERISIPKTVGFFRYIKELEELFIREKPDVVHAHTYYNSAFSMLAAKKVGIETRITHSHNTKSDVKEGIVYVIYKKIMKYIINKYSNVFLACGIDAGRAIFYKKNKYSVIYNGIETERFIFNKESRKLKREELGIKDDEFVIGNVARFMPVKNQSFLIDIFNEYLKINNKSKLILIGDGPTKEEIQKKVTKYNITEKVLFLGIRKDVNQLYNTMDLFVFPSLFEGFPVVLIETQINGLKALVSDNIDKTVKKSENIAFFDIVDSMDSILKLIEKNKEERKEKVYDLGELDIKNTLKVLCKYYESGNK